MRPSGRANDQLRDVRITRNFTKHAEGSVLIEFETIEGDTVPGNPVVDVPVEMEDTPVETAPPRVEERKPELEKPSRKTIIPAPQIAPVIPKGTGGPILASPAVRKRAREAQGATNKEVALSVEES